APPEAKPASADHHGKEKPAPAPEPPPNSIQSGKGLGDAPPVPLPADLPTSPDVQNVPSAEAGGEPGKHGKRPSEPDAKGTPAAATEPVPEPAPGAGVS